MIGLGIEAVVSPAVSGPACAIVAVVTMGITARPLVARPTLAEPSVPADAEQGARTRLPGRVRRALTIAAALSIAVVAGPMALGVATLAVVLVRSLRPIRAARRRRSAIERALPDAMDRLVLSVRAGLTPFQAVCDLATSVGPPIGDAFAEVVRRTERGQPFADGLAALPDHLGPLAGGLADVIATSDRHGLPLGPVLDQLTAEVRATRRRLDQADARKLPVRLSFPLVACTLPSFVLLAIAPAVIAALSSLGGSAW